MKNKFKLLCFLFLFALTFSIMRVRAIGITDVKSFKLYDVKDKEEVLVENNEIFKFFETNYEVLNDLIEERNEELRKIEEEKRLEEERKIQSIYIGTRIANFATQFVGGPYVMGGNSLTSGTDCSGFVMLVYASFGYSLPRTTYEQSISGYGVSADEIMPGDIISYGYNGYATHSALYIGNGMMIHASTPELGIRYDNMYILPIVAIRRVI